MKNRTYAILAKLTFVVLLLSLTIIPTESSAADGWSDSFDDPLLPNWTTLAGGWSADNGYLECTENATGGNDWSIIEHDSSVKTGTWSFDFYQNYMGWSFDFYVNEGELLYMYVGGSASGINVFRGMSELASWDAAISRDWHHCDVTMDETFLINVYVDGTRIIHYHTLDPLIDCEVIQITSSGDGNAFDDVVVSDTVDFDGTIATCPDCPQDPPPTSTDPTPTPDPTPLPPVPIELLAIAGGVGIVVLVLVLFMKRR